MFAEIEDLEIKLRRPLTDVETEDAERMLVEALNLIKAGIPDLATQAAESEVFAGIVKMVQMNAVCRVLRNPEGLKEVADEGYDATPHPIVSSGIMDIWPSEWKHLGVNPSVRSGHLSLDVFRFLPKWTA